VDTIWIQRQTQTKITVCCDWFPSLYDGRSTANRRPLLIDVIPNDRTLVIRQIAAAHLVLKYPEFGGFDTEEGQRLGAEADAKLLTNGVTVVTVQYGAALFRPDGDGLQQPILLNVIAELGVLLSRQRGDDGLKLGIDS
jgi:hypothetical protein